MNLYHFSRKTRNINGDNLLLKRNAHPSDVLLKTCYRDPLCVNNATLAEWPKAMLHGVRQAPMVPPQTYFRGLRSPRIRVHPKTCLGAYYFFLSGGERSPLMKISEMPTAEGRKFLGYFCQHGYLPPVFGWAGVWVVGSIHMVPTTEISHVDNNCISCTSMW